MTTRAPAFPAGCWPLEMRAPTAAAFVDEPSVEAFLAKVDKGVYSQPNRSKGFSPKWHRGKLEADIARRHGVRHDAQAEVEDVLGLI